ncbi:IMP cyclohydrolase [Nocardia yamanashiensis]|uniref:IMP cyclohydrolase n=1 Tax=Nocardia yamanashiensis TaxID=209247 RepID=UPI001E28AA88|nr:IMP cyclohydrolase [Nocardia yamanashiensis]UGT44217.1 IMP cyclohydrolase [Nocardia yamanashiensis]
MTLGFDEFVVRYRYPGRGIVLGRDADGAGFAAYWLTGRSEASRSRRMVVGPDELEIVDTTAGPSDPLRHYVAIMRTGDDRIVVGNGTQVGEVVANVAAGASMWKALTELECEPDPPILTPRITATAIVDGADVREVIMSGAVAHRRWPDAPSSLHNLVHVPALAVGEGYATTTYAGDTATVVTSGQPVAVQVNAPWPELLERVWAGLDPELRVAAAVVPLTGDLREGRFIGVHDPLLLQAGTDCATI